MINMQKAPSFIGLETTYLTANGSRERRIHLDGAASPLASSRALKTTERVLPHYSSTHSYVHNSARISTNAIAWAHQTVLEVLGAASQDYTAIFTGSGTTAAVNRVARGLSAARPERKIVFVSSMEHHANDLPHRQFGNEVVYLPLTGEGSQLGIVDLDKFQALCEQYEGKVNYVAVSSVSNVTGVKNPIKAICEIAQRHNIFTVIDGAQSVAHGPTDLSDIGVDFFVFSGHKVYTPGSPGVLVARKSLLDGLPGQDLGGGSVETVSYFDYQMLSTYPQKEESGTPNIVGAIALASVLNELQDYGFEQIKKHDEGLTEELIKLLTAIPQLSIYADKSLPRTGAIAFNVAGIDHGLLAAILNDYYAIAVRNECFCAHPYVSSLIKETLWELDLSDIPEQQQEAYINRKRGMVRASISLYNTTEDVRVLAKAIKEIIASIKTYVPLYKVNNDGSYQHTEFKLDWRRELGL